MIHREWEINMHTAQWWWKYHWLCCLYTQIHTHTHTYTNRQEESSGAHIAHWQGKYHHLTQSKFSHTLEHRMYKSIWRDGHTRLLLTDYLAEHHVLHHRSRPPPHTPVPVSASVATTGPVSPCYTYRSCFWPPVKAYWATSPFPLLKSKFHSLNWDFVLSVWIGKCCNQPNTLNLWI